jgi:hypothetical protein
VRGPLIVNLVFDVDVHVMGFRRPAGKGAEDVQFLHQAQRPLGLARVKRLQDVF